MAGKKSALSKLAKAVGKATREKTFEEQFMVMMDEFYQKRAKVLHEKHQKKHSKALYRPSMLWNCHRNLFYYMTNAPEDPFMESNPEMERLGEDGSDRHYRIQKALGELKDYGYPFEVVPLNELLGGKPHLQAIEATGEHSSGETRWYWPELELAFQPDGIAQYLGKIFFLEIKTAEMFKFNGVNFNNIPIKNQVQTWAYSLGTGLNYCFYLYEDRNYKRWKPMFVPIIDEQRQEVVDRIRQNQEYRRIGELPPCELDRCKKSYCKYRYQCRQDGGTPQ